MSEQGQRPAFRAPFPILYATDVERSVRFYCEHFGFEKTFEWRSAGRLEFAYLRLGETGIGIGDRDVAAELHGRAAATSGPARFELCLYVDDTDRACAALVAAGVEQVAPPRTMPWGERLAFFVDPDGNPIHVTARV